MAEIERSTPMMSSLDIAEVTGKQHSHVMEAIRKMEPAWVKLGQSNFRLTTYKDAQGKDRPCYQLTKTETLFVTTKFKDDARAKLVLRWEALETGKEKPMVEQKQELQPKTPAEMMLMYAQLMVDQEKRLTAIEDKVEKIEQEREENGRQLLALPVSASPVPEMTVRKNIIALVNSYCSSTNTAQQDVWHRIYQDLYYRYGKSINNYKRLQSDKSKLDIAERNGLLPYIMDIVSEMVSKTTQSV